MQRDDREGSANIVQPSEPAFQQSDKDMMLEIVFGSAAPMADRAIGVVTTPVGKQIAGAVGFVAAVGLIAHLGSRSTE